MAAGGRLGGLIGALLLAALVLAAPLGGETAPPARTAGLARQAAAPVGTPTPANATAPTVTIEQGTAQADPTGAATIAFVATFDEPVTGLIATDVILGGTAGATTATVGGGPTVYTIVVTGMAQAGTVTATLAPGAAQDAANNASAASTSADNVVIYAPPCAERFVDVPADSPACDAIVALADRGVIKGYATTPPTYGPGDPVQRAQVAVLLVRARHWEGRSREFRTFSDIAWLPQDMRDAVLIVANACQTPFGDYSCVGRGYVDGRFGPDDPVTYGQVITFISRAFSLNPSNDWLPQTAWPQTYRGVPAEHDVDVRTFDFYAGAIPDAPTTPEGWNSPAPRAWVARVLWLALLAEF